MRLRSHTRKAEPLSVGAGSALTVRSSCVSPLPETYDTEFVAVAQSHIQVVGRLKRPESAVAALSVLGGIDVLARPSREDWFRGPQIILGPKMLTGG